MSKLTNHHLTQVFTRVFKDKKFTKSQNIDSTLEILLEETSGFNPPCDYSNTFTFSDRVPIFAEKSLKSDSDLCQALYDRSGEVAIVADSVMSSLQTLHLVTLTEDLTLPSRWLGIMNPKELFMYTRNVSEQDIIVISKLSSFIKNYA